MRTTLTLEDDVEAKLKEEMGRSGESFKRTVNRVLRRGLNAPRAADLSAPFEIEPRDLGLREGVDLDNVGDLLEELDGPGHR